jgi:hypothetical protein
MSSTTSDEGPDDVDTLVPDPQVQRELGGVSAMTLHRWTNNPALGFPPKLKIGDRNFRSRKQLEQFKQQLMLQAMHERARRPAAQHPDVTPPAPQRGRNARGRRVSSGTKG